MDGSGSRSDPFSLWRASDTLTQIAAELARGTPALALIGDMPWAERSSLIERLSNYLEGENIRVIVVDGPDHGPGGGGPGDGPIGLRRFCELLAAASPSSAPARAPARDTAEHLAMIFTSPEADEHGLVLIVARADVLSTEALTFAERLATASGGSPLPVQLLLLGSPALESRLPEAGSFVIQSLASIAAARAQSTIGTAPGRWRGRGLAAIGGVAALIFFLAAASGDREPEHVPEQAAAAVVLPAHATPSVTLADHDASPVGAISAQPVTLAERDTIAEAPPPPSDPVGAAVEPPQAATVVDAPLPVSAPPLAAAPPSAASDAAPVPAPMPAATATTEQVPAAGEPLPQAVPASPPAADVVASPPAEMVPPSAADAAPSAAPAASPAATQQVPAGEPLPRSAMETAPVATPDNASPPVATQPEAVTPSVADADDVASPPEAPAAAPAAAVTTERAPADAPPPQSVPEEAATAGAGSLPATVQPETVAPRAVDAAIPVLSAAPAAEQPRATPSPAASALLARGDELIAIGDVATARVVYERAAALKSGRGATSTGRTYDPRFLHQIGAVGVVPDPAAAAAWYRKGAALGDEGAASLLGDPGSGASQ